MKKTLVNTLIAIPFLALPYMASAAEPADPGSSSAEPVLLSADQMDGITAGSSRSREYSSGLPNLEQRGHGMTRPKPTGPDFFISKLANVTQINMSPVTIVQIGSNNTAIVYSGNFSTISQ